MNSSRRLDILSGIFFILIAAMLIWLVIPYGVQEPKKVKFLALSPSYYPRLVAYCLLGFGSVLLISRFFKGSENLEQTVNTYREHWFVVLAGIIATLVAWYASLEWLGFVLSSAIALFILLLMAGERKAIALLAIPVTLPMALHLFFNKVANIPIPAGVLRSVIGGA